MSKRLDDAPSTPPAEGRTDGGFGGMAATGIWLLPVVALLIGLALTALVAVNRGRAIDAEQQRMSDGAQTDFIVTLADTAGQVESEVDRVQELMMGLTAFASSQDFLTQSASDRYLQTTDATSRFSGLEAVVITTTSPATEANNAINIEVGNQPSASEALVTEIENRLSEPPNGATTFISEHTNAGVSYTVAHSQISTILESGWASLVFTSDDFLSRALPTRTDATIDLVSANTSFVAGAANEAMVEVLTEGQVSGSQTIDVFGSAYRIEGLTSENFIPEASTNEVRTIWIAGLVASLALLAVATILAVARKRAVDFARSSNAERVAIDRRFRASFQNAPIGMAELDSAGRLVAINEAFAAQSGATRDDLAVRSLSDLVHTADREAHRAVIHSLARGEREAAQSEHRYRHVSGREVWVNESISIIDKDDEGQPSLLVQSQDVTARRRAAWELARQALHDDLTGLPNRALFLNRLNNAIERAGRNPGYVAVMFIDVDRFKMINDSLGHETGDQFLIEISERVGTAVRTGDTVARFGGDEFVVLCENVNGEGEANLVAQRIQQSFADPFILAGQPTYATVSLGITLSKGTDCTADSLLRDADAAMYRAKEGGRNRTEIFNHKMRSSLVARMEIESQLRTALDNGEMVLHFQAIVDPQTYLPVGYEALIRWNHPEKGLLGPGAFLPVAEEAGLIHLVDSFVLRSTCLQIAAWAKEFSAARHIYVSVNWSARHLGAFVQQVEQVLAETGIDPTQLVIEVTEGFLLDDSDGSLKTLQRLKALGVAIAIDDFGTGYSSLSYLTRLDVDYLKIDQSFVSKLPEDQASAAVIGAIADMANRLGIKLIAEGVETDDQMHMLAQLGSPRLQGYRFAKPRPASHIAQHLAERSAAGFTTEGIDPESPRVLANNAQQ